MKTLVLTHSDVRSLLSMAMVIPAVEQAFAAHGRGEVLMPPKVYVDLPEHHGDFRAMPSAAAGLAGLKWVSSHPENPARNGLPCVMGVYILSDPATALPLAILDGTLLTAWRTGAAGAVASRHLGPCAPRTIGLVGCGVQARVLLMAHRELWPDLRVLAADTSGDAAAAFVRELGGTVTGTREAAGADIVCTSTPSTRPVVLREWVSDGAHINAMGADAPGKQELDPVILSGARVFVDDLAQAPHSGEINVPLHAGTFALSDIAGTLGQVVAGLAEGRRGNETTVFDSTGLAVQDLLVARALVDEARARGLGLEVDLMGVGAHG